MGKAKISILGSCVSRDFIDYANNNLQGEHCVEKYIHFISNYSILNGGGVSEFTPELFDGIDISNFRKRCICLDLNKQALNYLSQAHSDYLIYDFANTRLAIAKSEEKNIIFTQHIGTDRCIDIIKQITDCCDFSLHHFYDLSEEELINSTERLLDKLLELYRPEQIVLNCFYGAERYITKQGTLKKFAPVAIDFFKNGILFPIN